MGPNYRPFYLFPWIQRENISHHLFGDENQGRMVDSKKTIIKDNTLINIFDIYHHICTRNTLTSFAYFIIGLFIYLLICFQTKK